MDTSCLKFPVNPGNEAMMTKFEVNNDISINIYGLYDDDDEGDYENDDDDGDGVTIRRVKSIRNHPSYHLE